MKCPCCSSEEENSQKRITTKSNLLLNDTHFTSNLTMIQKTFKIDSYLNESKAKICSNTKKKITSDFFDINSLISALFFSKQTSLLISSYISKNNTLDISLLIKILSHRISSISNQNLKNINNKIIKICIKNNIFSIVILSFDYLDIYVAGVFTNEVKGHFINILLMHLLAGFFNIKIKEVKMSNVSKSISPSHNPIFYQKTNSNPNQFTTPNQNMQISYINTISPIYQIIVPLLSYHLARILYEKVLVNFPGPGLFFHYDSLLIELESEKILCSFCGLISKNGLEKRLNFSKNSLINEIIYHGKILKSKYLQNHGWGYSTINCGNEAFNASEKSFEKYTSVFECLATYPRLIFIIKFIPVFNGLILVHSFRENRLSKDSSEMSIYKEIDVDFSHNNPHIQLIEQFHLKKFQDFMIEYFALIKEKKSEQNENGFYCFNKNYCLKYISDDILQLLFDNINDREILMQKLVQETTENNENPNKIIYKLNETEYDKSDDLNIVGYNKEEYINYLLDLLNSFSQQYKQGLSFDTTKKNIPMNQIVNTTGNNNTNIFGNILSNNITPMAIPGDITEEMKGDTKNINNTNLFKMNTCDFNFTLNDSEFENSKNDTVNDIFYLDLTKVKKDCNSYIDSSREEAKLNNMIIDKKSGEIKFIKIHKNSVSTNVFNNENNINADNLDIDNVNINIKSIESENKNINKNNKTEIYNKEKKELISDREKERLLPNQ